MALSDEHPALPVTEGEESKGGTPARSPAWFYLLRLRSGAFYAGATTDLDRRYREHLSGNGCRTTRVDPPVALVYSEQHSDLVAARKREVQIKRWTRAKKAALADGELDRLKQLAQRRSR